MDVAGVSERVDADSRVNLLERDLELGTVDALFERMRSGRGGRLLIEGPAGIGKSALLDAALERAREQGMTCLEAVGVEVASSVAFGVARAALGPMWVSTTDADGGGDQPDAVPATLQRTVQAVLDLAEESPVVVCIDDVQWADAASVRWLSLLAQRATGSRVIVALGVRTEDAERHPALDELLNARRAVVVRPAPLSVDAAGQLIETVLGAPADAALARACHAETGGNPYLLSALAHGLRQSGITSGEVSESAVREVGARVISRGVALRIEGLDPPARALVESLSVVGDVGGMSEVANVAGVMPADAADAASVLLRAGLLRSVQPPEVAHPLIGAAIRAQLPARRREELARAATVRLLAAGRVEDAAGHLFELPPRGDPETVATLLEAARLATARGAPDVAASLVQRALAEPPPPEREVEAWAALGSAQLASGHPDAVASLEQAVARTPSGAGRGALAELLALALAYEDSTGKAIGALDSVRADLGPEHGELREQLEAVALHYTCFRPEHRAEGERRLARWQGQRPKGELAYRLVLAEQARHSLLNASPAAETAVLAERALAGGVLLSRARAQHSVAVLNLAFAGRTAIARGHIQDGIAEARRRGDVMALAVHVVVHGEVRRIEGDMVAVELDTRTGFDLLPYGERGPRFMMRGLIEALVEQGQVEAASEAVRGADLAGEMPPSISAPGMLYARAMMRRATGSSAGALEDLLRAGEIAELMGLRDPISVPWRLAAAELMLELDDRRGAAALVGEHLELAQRVALRAAIGPAVRVRGLLEGGAAGLRSLAEAVELLDGSFAQLELARALVDLGLASRDGDPSAARAVLQRGATLAGRLGASVLAGRAETAMLAAGGRPRRVARRGVEALTAAERRAARLAAEGLTNREIAETLVLSEKTIESHMASCFRKLGIRSRTQLTAALGGDERAVGALAEHDELQGKSQGVSG